MYSTAKTPKSKSAKKFLHSSFRDFYQREIIKIHFEGKFDFCSHQKHIISKT